MDFFDIFFYLSVFAGIMMSFSLGANDVANSMASAVGARAITIWQAVAIAGSMNFIGAVFLGSRVVDTVSNGILHGSLTSNPELITLVMFAALLTAGFWVLFSSWTGFPVSSTQSIIGGLFGVGLVAGGFSGVQWSTMIEIFLTWVISPFLGGFISWFIYALIKWSILNVRDPGQRMSAAKKWSPVWMGLAGGLIMGFLILDIESGKHLREEAFWIGLSVVFTILFLWQTGKMMLKEHMQILQEKTRDTVGANNHSPMFPAYFP